MSWMVVRPTSAAFSEMSFAARTSISGGSLGRSVATSPIAVSLRMPVGFSSRVALDHSTFGIMGILSDVSELERSAIGHAQVTAHVLQINGMVR